LGCEPNVAHTIGQLSLTLGYYMGFSPNVDDNAGLQNFLISNAVAYSSTIMSDDVQCGVVARLGVGCNVMSCYIYIYIYIYIYW